MKRYALAVEGKRSLEFFYKNLDGFIVLTRIAPTTYPNKKKAKRVLKRLKKSYGDDWFIFQLEV